MASHGSLYVHVVEVVFFCQGATLVVEVTAGRRLEAAVSRHGLLRSRSCRVSSLERVANCHRYEKEPVDTQVPRKVAGLTSARCLFGPERCLVLRLSPNGYVRGHLERKGYMEAGFGSGCGRTQSTPQRTRINSG